MCECFVNMCTVFCIVCTVFLYCVYVYLFLFVGSVSSYGLMPPSDNSIAVLIIIIIIIIIIISFCLQILSEIYLILRRNQGVIVINAHRSSCQLLFVLLKF